MTTSERIDPSTLAGEREMLESWLDYHRETLALKCAGLSDKQLKEASVPPSELTLIGLVRHMAEVERGWFRNTLAAERAAPLFFTDEDPDGDFHPGADDTWEQAHTAWRAEIAHARSLAAPHSLDDRGAGRRERASGDPFTLRWIYLHMIEEYARHNGHADLIRECVDGATGE
ncbi:DinB family protein [Streptomyces corynorhini]|uniref:DinB family protein n=1 Tax=Streptomyces corynorhini TaxID=2282652 RepID=A0A370ASS5_9ACTN|nr:DinB family protein [Streptomyces corynorhini]RDG32618.1 DinB family protein [Streptomyces corynorhini]